MNAVENALIQIGRVLFHFPDQVFDDLAFGRACISEDGIFRKTAGTAEKFQLVIAGPRDDILLVDFIERPYELHALEMVAVELRKHGPDLGAVEHAHDGRLDDVVKMVPEGNLVAAELFCFAVQPSAAHFGAEVAGAVVLGVCDRKDIGVEYGDGDMQKGCVGIDFLPVLRTVPRVHDEKDVFKRDISVALDFLHEFCHEHGILAAGDAHGDPVACFDEAVTVDCVDKRMPQDFPVLFYNASLNELMGLQLSGHASILSVPASAPYR